MPQPGEGWTVEEAAVILDPPITPDELRAAVTAARIQPLGKRSTGRKGRPAAVYDLSALLRAHAALVALWMGESAS